MDGVMASSSFQASVSPLQVCSCTEPDAVRALGTRLAFRLWEGRAVAPGTALPLGRGIQTFCIGDSGRRDAVLGQTVPQAEAEQRFPASRARDLL